MKLIKNCIINTVYVFSVLSVVFGILCVSDILESMPYEDIVFILLLMSAATSLFITIREQFLPISSSIKHIIDIAGCVIIIFAIGYSVGWLSFNSLYLLLITGTIIIVYLLVWLITWLGAKHDEDDLNNLLHKNHQK